MPITRELVEERLAVPDAKEIRVLAASIKSPLLKSVPFDDRDGLSPDEAAILAVLLNPSLRVARDQKALAEAQLLQAELLPNPALSYDLEVPSGGKTAGTVTGFGFGLDWDVTSLINRSAKANKAEAHRASVDLDVAWQEWQVAQGAKNSVYQLASLRGQVALAEEIQQDLSEDLTLLRQGVENGTRTATDLFAAQTTFRQAEAALIDLKKQAEQQRLRLNRLLGFPLGMEVHLQEGMVLPPSFDLPPVKELCDGLEQRRLDLIALRRGYDSQEAGVRAAILDQFPKISIGPTIGRGTDNVDTVGFGLTIELPIFNRNQGRIAVERATRQRLFDEYVDRVFQAQSDIQMIMSRIRFLNEQIAAAQEAEPDLQKLEENYRAALDAGRADALVYYAARKDMSSNRMKVLSLKGQLAEAVVALELAAGMYEIPRPN